MIDWTNSILYEIGELSQFLFFADFQEQRIKSYLIIKVLFTQPGCFSSLKNPRFNFDLNKHVVPDMDVLEK